LVRQPQPRALRRGASQPEHAERARRHDRRRSRGLGGQHPRGRRVLRPLPQVGRRAFSVVRRAESFVAPLLVWRCLGFPSSWSASFIAAGIASELSEPSSLMRAYTRVARPSLTGAPVTAFFATQFQCRVWTPISASVIVVRIRSPYAAGPINLKWISPITKVVRSFLIICSIGKPITRNSSCSVSLNQATIRG